MVESDIIRYSIEAFVLLVGLFMTVYKPLNENTKAMTTLSVKVEQLTEKITKQEEDFEDYKKHVSVSQQKQWDAINEHENMILQNSMKIEHMKER